MVSVFRRPGDSVRYLARFKYVLHVNQCQIWDSKWCNEINFSFVECIVGSAYLNTYLPVTTHTQVSVGTEVFLPVREQVDTIRPHIHIEHSRV